MTSPEEPTDAGEPTGTDGTPGSGEPRGSEPASISVPPVPDAPVPGAPVPDVLVPEASTGAAPVAEDPPGSDVERVPLKVVPIYVQPIDDAAPTDDERADGEPAEVVADEPKPRRAPALWIAAAFLALATIGTHIAAIVVASAGEFVTGTTLGYVSIAASGLAVLVGIVALILGRGRLWSALAIIVALLANPFLLLAILTFLSGLQTG